MEEALSQCPVVTNVGFWEHGPQAPQRCVLCVSVYVCVCVCVCVISALLTLHQDITESTLSKETYNRVKRDLVQYSSHSTTSLTHSLTHLHTIYM